MTMPLSHRIPEFRTERVPGQTWRGFLQEAHAMRRPTSRLAPDDKSYINGEFARIREQWGQAYNPEASDFAERLAAILAKQISVDACLADRLNDLLNGTDVIAVVSSGLSPSSRDEDDVSIVGIDVTIGAREIEKKLSRTLKRVIEIPHLRHRDYVYVPDSWKEDADLSEGFKDRLPGGPHVSDRVFRVPTVAHLPFATIKEQLTDAQAKDAVRLFALQLTLQCRDLGLLCANRLSQRIDARPADLQTMRDAKTWMRTLDWMWNPGQVRLGKMALGYLDGYEEFEKPLISSANQDGQAYRAILQGSSLSTSDAWRTLVERHKATPLFALVTATLETAQTIENLCRGEAEASRLRAA